METFHATLCLWGVCCWLSYCCVASHWCGCCFQQCYEKILIVWLYDSVVEHCMCSATFHKELLKACWQVLHALCFVFDLCCHAHACFYIDGCENWWRCFLTNCFVVGDVALNHWCFVELLRWLSDLPFACTHTGHQLLYGKCASSCSSLSCAVGCCGAGRPFAFLISCCSSTSSVMYSSLYAVVSSNFVEPVHSWSSVACLFVVQLSSILYHLAPFVGLTIVVRSVVTLVTSGPSSVCCGM